MAAAQSTHWRVRWSCTEEKITVEIVSLVLPFNRTLIFILAVIFAIIIGKFISFRFSSSTVSQARRSPLCATATIAIAAGSMRLTWSRTENLLTVIQIVSDHPKLKSTHLFIDNSLRTKKHKGVR